MCTTCLITLGGFVGAVAALKRGGLGGAKTAMVTFATSVILRRPR